MGLSTISEKDFLKKMENKNIFRMCQKWNVSILHNDENSLAILTDGAVVVSFKKKGGGFL
jgi:hypothetical protein